MELNELRYFLTVAEIGNINKAANKLLVSPGTLSKAIAKLELQLGINLFERVGRVIKITDQGRHLQMRASQILNLEETARAELTGGTEVLNVKICGEEMILAEYGTPIVRHVLNLYPNAVFEIETCSNAQALEKVYFGEAHLAITTSAPSKDLVSKIIDKAMCQTCIGNKHPLYKYVKADKAVDIEELLQHRFVVPRRSILGKIQKNQSLDGWRDDKFPRKIGFKVTGIKSLESLLASGLVVAYLPSYLAENIKAHILSVTGCPYTCEQVVHLSCRDPQELGWLNRIW